MKSAAEEEKKQIVCLDGSQRAQNFILIKNHIFKPFDERWANKLTILMGKCLQF